ncbi:MAG: hypothetical protein ACSLFP_08370 [Acidimicrobiales bacterium]
MEAVTTSAPDAAPLARFATAAVVAVVDGDQLTGEANVLASSPPGTSVEVWHRDGVLSDHIYSTWPAAVFVIILLLWAVWAVCLAATRWGDQVLATVAHRAGTAEARSARSARSTV